MTNIIIGDIAEGQKWYGQVEFMKQQLVNTYRSNNAFMSTWKQLSPDVKVFIKMVAGKPQAFIYAGREYYVYCALGNPYQFAIPWSPKVAVSLDGMLWTNVFLPDTIPAYTLSGWGFGAYNGDVIVGVNYLNTGKATLSYDGGITWENVTLPEVAYWTDIAWNGEYFCMISQETLPSGVAYSAVSPDGINWTTGLMPSNGIGALTLSSWNSIDWNGEVFCAIGASVGTYPARTAISPDGINWTATDGLGDRFWVDVAWNGEVFCAVASGYTGQSYVNDKCATSADGITWDLNTLPSTNGDWWASIVWNGKVFCAVPLTVGIPPSLFRTMTSPNGVDWTMSEYEPLPALNWDDVGWSGKEFYMVTSTGTTFSAVATSFDGLNWVEQEISACAVSGGVISKPVGVKLIAPSVV